MTKWQGYKNVRIASIKMDVADIRRRSKAAHVSDLAQSIRDNGEELIHAPTVRLPAKTLLCGRDRMAALTILKQKKVWVRLVKCDDNEAKRLELTENAHRRTENRAELFAQLVDLKEQQIRAEIELTQGSGAGSLPASERRVTGPASDPETQAGQKAIKAAARAGAARDGGVTASAVRKAEQRAEESSAPPSGSGGGECSAPAAEAEEPAPTLELLGCNDASAEAVAKFARKDQDAIDEADKHLRLAQAALSRMTPGDVAQDLKAQVHRVASLVRSHRPASVCPWCKGLPKSTVSGCLPCLGLGYVPEEKLSKDRCPRELLDVDAPMVAIDGVFYPYADVRDGKLPAKNGKPAKPTQKKVRVEDAAGNPFPGIDETAPDAEEAY